MATLSWQAVKDGWHGSWFSPKDGAASLRSDFVGVAALTVAIPIVRYILHKLLLQPVGRYMIVGRVGSPQRMPDKLRAKVDKFAESFWKLLAYGTFSYMAFSAAIDEPWFRDTSYFWRGYPNQPLSCELVKAALSRIYCLEMAFYASGIGMLLFWEIRRKDFMVMMTHHIATLILISLSYYLGFTRVGCMIMLLHDVCDVLMEAAKMFKYCNQEFWSSVTFGVFMLTWVALRLTYFPFWIIWSTSVESTEVLGYQVPYYHVFNGLLCLLTILHAYWFSLISKIAWSTLRTGSTDDSRESDD